LLTGQIDVENPDKN